MTTKNKIALHVAIVLLSLLPFVFLGTVYSELPEQVPTHFNVENNPDDYSTKSSLWFLTSLLAAVSIGVYFLLRNIGRIDPKRKGQLPSSTFNKLGVGLAVIITCLSFLALASAAGHFESLKGWSFLLLGALLVFLGNYMHSIRPNYFAGFRLPWTLSDDENWRLTHRLGGRVWVAGGLVIAIAGFILSGTALEVVLISTIVVLIVVPLVYSLILYKRKNSLQQQG